MDRSSVGSRAFVDRLDKSTGRCAGEKGLHREIAWRVFVECAIEDEAESRSLTRAGCCVCCEKRRGIDSFTRPTGYSSWCRTGWCLVIRFPSSKVSNGPLVFLPAIYFVPSIKLAGIILSWTLSPDLSTSIGIYKACYQHSI